MSVRPDGTVSDVEKPDAFTLISLVKTIGLTNALMLLILAILAKPYWSGYCG